MAILHEPNKRAERRPERELTDDDIRRIRALMSPVHRLYREGIVSFGRPRRAR